MDSVLGRGATPLFDRRFRGRHRQIKRGPNMIHR